jgi:hypothetical protein
VDPYRPLEFQVFVLRYWREGTSGVWRGQIVHLPDQETASFAHWEQAQAFIGRFVMDKGPGIFGDSDNSSATRETRGDP